MSGMVYGIFLVLLCLWGTGSQCLSRLGLKAGSYCLTGMIFGCFGLSYLVGLFYNFGLYNTNHYSSLILLTYLLVALMVSFFLIPLSLIAALYLPATSLRIDERSEQL
ncbi:MAG: hypothetical protein KDA70_03525 [Planctomycetaceae bacterium]|nr:hypothetical protein [Planctomycetaceae bacterium]